MSRSLPDRSDPTASMTTARSSQPGSAESAPTLRRRTNADRIPADGSAAPSAQACPVTARKGQRPSTAHTKAYRSQSQGAKATQSGAATELRVNELLTQQGLRPQPLARVTGTRLSGEGQILDNCCFLDDLKGIITPIAGPDGPINVVVSVKAQYSLGSLKQKLPTEIDDLGHFTDTTGLPAVLVLSAPVLRENFVRELEQRARQSGIALITFAQLKSGAWSSAVLRAHILREPLRNAARLEELRQLNTQLTDAEFGWMDRERTRAAVTAA